MYYKALRNMRTNYPGGKTKQLLTHLYSTYGNITTNDIADNHTKINTRYDPNLPIEYVNFRIPTHISVPCNRIFQMITHIYIV